MAEEKILDAKVAERLNKIDWDGLKAATGITRAQIEKDPKIASQLVYGQVTDLVYGNTPDISGLYALRAVPEKDENKVWKVKAYTVDKEKTMDDKIFLYGAEIYSEKAKKALFEQTSWENSEGKKVFGRANANAGIPVGIEFVKEDGTKEKQHFLVSLHGPTNRLFGMPIDAVRAMLQNPDGTARNVQAYGATLTDAQVEAICTGRAVKVDGCKDRAGNEFSTCLQFDVTKRQLVPVHPTWLKEAEKAGVDLGIGRKEAAEKKPEIKKGPKGAKKTETQAQKPAGGKRKLA